MYLRIGVFALLFCAVLTTFELQSVRGVSTLVLFIGTFLFVSSIILVFIGILQGFFQKTLTLLRYASLLCGASIVYNGVFVLLHR